MKRRRSRTTILSWLALGLATVMLLGQPADKLADYLEQGEEGESVQGTVFTQALRLPAYAVQLLDWKLTDFIHSVGKPAPTHPEVVIVGIDTASMELTNAFPEDIQASSTLQLMQAGWPWSRAVYAEVVDKLLTAGARQVIIDLMFPGPSTSHPEGDDIFKKMLQKHSGKVVLAADYTRTLSGNHVVPSISLPAEEILPEEGTKVGFVTYWPETDGVVRNARFVRSMSEEIGKAPDPSDLVYHSLVAEAVGAEAKLPTLHEQGATIHFAHPDSFEPVSLHELLVPDLWQQNFHNGADFKDKYVFIGPAASHMQDFHFTPVGRLLGVQLHAHVLSAVLTQSWLTPLGKGWQWVLTPAAIGLGWLLLLSMPGRPVLLLFAFLLMSLLMLVGSWAAFSFASLSLPLLTPLLGLNAFGLSALAYDHVLARRRMNALRGQLTRYFSPDHAEELLRDPEGVEKLTAGQRRVVVVLFSDVRGFTSMAETRPADELVAQLNAYLDRMVQIAFGQRGMIDKFIGDAIMAIWGRMGGLQSAESAKQDATRAVTTALQMRQGLAELNAGWRAEGQPELAFGIGLHQGEAIVGDIGSVSMPRMEFTVIGDAVNTGARLESATKQYGVDLLISDAIHLQVADSFLCRSVDLSRPVGKTVPVPTYTVISELGALPPAGLVEYELGIVAYRKGNFPEAKECFQAAAALGLMDKLTQLYLDRVEQLLHAPPETWDGVYVMTKK